MKPNPTRGGRRANQTGRPPKAPEDRAVKAMVVFTPEHWLLIKGNQTSIVREALDFFYTNKKAAP